MADIRIEFDVVKNEFFHSIEMGKNKWKNKFYLAANAKSIVGSSTSMHKFICFGRFKLSNWDERVKTEKIVHQIVCAEDLGSSICFPPPSDECHLIN